MVFLDKGWREWICHTNFSFLIGASHPRELISRAAQLGYKSLGITDYDGVYGIARAYRELGEIQRENPGIDLKLRYGSEIHLVKDHALPIYFQKTLILYAQSHRGYYNLCHLLSYSHREGKTEPNLPLDYLLSSPVDDLVAIQPMRGVIREKEGSDRPLLARYFGRLKEHFLGRFYFALSRHLNSGEDRWILPTVELARRLGSPTVLSQDVFFATPCQKDISDVLHAIRHNKTLDEVSDQLFMNGQRYLHPIPSLQKIYSEIPGVEMTLRHSRQLDESFEFDLCELTYHYPREMLPDGVTPIRFLERLVWKEARKKYGRPLPTSISNILSHELSLVQRLGFADYFLTVWDIVSWARSREILCQGRGSAANSAICYVLGITAINPDKFDLLFERFISVERGDPPDIDVDFENARREEVIQYIYSRYGRDKAAMVCNVITFKSRGAIRFSGKALGIPERVIDRASKLRGDIRFRGGSLKETIFGAKRSLKHSDENSRISDFIWELWANLSERILYFPRFLGIHSGGFMLSEKSVNWLVPQEPATMKGRTVIQWSKEDIEALGFFKIDILALGMLTAIRKCLRLIQKFYGDRLTLSTIPPDDPETYKMIQRADTTGVFQIESTAQKSSLPALRPATFYDLVVQVAIIRPGPVLAGIKHPYLRRRNGFEPVVYADPRLEPILRRTYGTIIFQEQLMRVAMAIGNFTPGEANEIRKNIGSFSAKGNIGKWVGKLTQGMIDNNIDESFIKEVIQQIKGFSSYGFPESHAASFALLAYASSYLKCHYPAAFFVSILNSQPMGFYQPDTLIKTARLDGVTVLPICVNHSGWDATLERINNAQGEPEFAIRLGFNQVVGISKTGVDSFVEKRTEAGGWSSLEVFLASNSLSRTDLTALAASNALLSLGVERKSAIWLAEAAPFQDYLENRELNPLFITRSGLDDQRVQFSRETEMESVEADYQSTKTSLGRHLSLIIKERAWVYPIPVKQLIASNVLSEKYRNRFITIFGMILVRQSPGTARKMLFVTLEDEYGTIQTVIRPNIYVKYAHIIEKHSFLCAQGKFQINNGSCSVLVSRVLHPIVRRADVISVAEGRRYKRVNSGNLRKIRNYI